MEFVLDLPDELLAEATNAAALRGMTFNDLFIRAVKNEIHPIPSRPDQPHFTIDESGFPILRREPGSGIVITQDFVDRLKEEEGI